MATYASILAWETPWTEEPIIPWQFIGCDCPHTEKHTDSEERGWKMSPGTSGWICVNIEEDYQGRIQRSVVGSVWTLMGQVCRGEQGLVAEHRWKGRND